MCLFSKYVFILFIFKKNHMVNYLNGTSKLKINTRIMCSELAKATVSFNLNLVLGLHMGLGRFLISTFKSKYGFFEI